MLKSHQILFIVLSSFFITSASAQKRGEILINFGMVHIAPQSELKAISSNEPVVNGALQGSGISSSKSSTLSFGASYMLTDNISAEMAFGIPPKMKFSLNTPSGIHTDAINTTVILPALLANYHFGHPSDSFRPFIGGGISYNRFTKAGYNTSNPVVAGLARDSIDINSAWSSVYKIGATYKIDEKWFLNSAILMIPVNVKGQLSGPGIGAGPAVTELSIRLKTNIYTLSLSRKF